MPRSANRDQAIEFTRIVAAFGVVVFHVGAPGSPFFYAGLLYFVFLSPYLAGKYRYGDTHALLQLAKTFLLPWVCWYVFYACLTLAVAEPYCSGNNLTVGCVFLIGPSLHMWFLPAMFLFLALAHWAMRRVSQRWVFWGSAMLANLLISSFPHTSSAITEWAVPYKQWGHALPMALLGLAFGCHGGVAFRRGFAWGTAICASLLALLSPLPDFAITYPFAIFVTLFVITYGHKYWPEGVSVQRWANCTLGVYMLHIFFIGLFNQILGQGHLLTAIASFLASIYVIYTLRRQFPKLKRFV